MDRFSELIANGVAAFEYKTITGDITDTYPQDLVSQMIRDYNNLYSIATNTHMGRTGDNRIVITGTLINDPKYFDRFLCSNYYKNLTFDKCPVCFFKDYGFVGHYEILNNDSVYVLEPAEEHPELAKCEICQDNCICTSESNIPRNVRFISTSGNFEDVKECVTEDTAKSLNESKYIIGDNWMVVGLSTGYHLMEMNQKIMIK
jgi:hypothetical protein